MKTQEEFFAGFTKATIRRPNPLKVGDHVKIIGDMPGEGETGRIIETGIAMPWCNECIKVDRDTGTGKSIYMPTDVRRI